MPLPRPVERCPAGQRRADAVRRPAVERRGAHGAGQQGDRPAASSGGRVLTAAAATAWKTTSRSSPSAGDRRDERAVRLPAAVGGRAGVEQPQTRRRRRVPRDVAVPEDQHVGVGEARRAAQLPPLRIPGLVDDGEPDALDLGPGDLRQALAERPVVVVAVHRHQPRDRASNASSRATSTQSPAWTTTSASSIAAHSA